MTATRITEGADRELDAVDDLGSLAVIGTCWRRVGVEALTRFTLSEEARAERLRRLKERLQAPELVYLATCNRVEVVLRRPPSSAPVEELASTVFRALTGLEPRPGEVERALCCWTDDAAVEHLFLVAAGLDSAQVGEREIQGQLRAAAMACDELGLSGPRLGEVVGEALRVAHLVHRRTAIGRGRLSLAEIGLAYLRDRLETGPGAVALVGVSTMTRRCAYALAEEEVPLILVNRTPEKAGALAGEISAKTGAEAVRWRSLEDFRRSPDAVEALLLATSSTQPVLDHYDLEQLVDRTAKGSPPLLVDMAVPPDIDPGSARALGMVRVGMAEITAEAETFREQRLAEAAPARDMIVAAVANLRRRRAERLLAPVIAQLQQRYRDTVADALRELESSTSGTDKTAEQGEVERRVAALAKRLSHIPTVGLRALASQAGAQAVRAFLSVDGDLLECYIEALESEDAGGEPGDGDLQALPPIEARR